MCPITCHLSFALACSALCVSLLPWRPAHGESLPLFPSTSLCPWNSLAGIRNSAFSLLTRCWLISTLLTRGNRKQSLHIIDRGDDPIIMTVPVSRLHQNSGYLYSAQNHPDSFMPCTLLSSKFSTSLQCKTYSPKIHY